MAAFSVKNHTQKELAMKSQHYQHLTLEQRIEIQQCLAHNMSFNDIGKRICKDQTTVSREVKRHIVVRQTTVTRTAKDGTPMNEPCKLLLKAPFVCNPCKHFHRVCSFDKHVYSAKDAQKAYESDLRTSREGIPINKEAFYENYRIITDGIRNGQHLYHILQTHDLGVSIPTVYRHLKKGYMSVSAVEFPRVVKFKPRSHAYAAYVPKANKIGRSYADFLLLREEMGWTAWVEMDTVIGRVGGKVILTFDFIFCNFMFGFLLPDKSAASVSSAILALKKHLDGHGIPFGTVFPIILTDNGGEFSDVAAIENDLCGNKETHLFYCDPSQSSQKPHVEKNHTLFRDVVPQGSSFEEFTQDTVNLIFSHVNCVKRKTLHGRTPYQLLAFTFGAVLPDLLDIEDIPAEQVV
jgi:IS30 family transposase